MDGHAEVDMSVHARGSILSRLRSPEGFTSASHYFVMDWVAIWVNIVVGLLIAGARRVGSRVVLAVVVPAEAHSH